jgi:hypothetical protein
MKDLEDFNPFQCLTEEDLEATCSGHTKLTQGNGNREQTTLKTKVVESNFTPTHMEKKQECFNPNIGFTIKCEM